MFWIGFFSGICIGFFVGFVMCALLSGNKRGYIK